MADNGSTAVININLKLESFKIMATVAINWKAVINCSTGSTAEDLIRSAVQAALFPPP
jgi:hypothetical protein